MSFSSGVPSSAPSSPPALAARPPVTPEDVRGAKALAADIQRARADALLLTAAGGAGGLAIAWQTAAAAGVGARGAGGLRGHPAARGCLLLAGAALGALALAAEAVADRAHLWDRSTWAPGVARAVELADENARRRVQAQAQYGRGAQAPAQR